LPHSLVRQSTDMTMLKLSAALPISLESRRTSRRL
jgi:hypothetical protein